MSTLKTAALRGINGTADSMQLHNTNQSVTFPGDCRFGYDAGAGSTSGSSILLLEVAG